MAIASAAFPGCRSDVSIGPESLVVSIGHATSVAFTGSAVIPFGTFNGVDFVRYTGRFEGTTSLGEFRMPFEIIAPADPADGNGTILFEPPHFAFGALGRDVVLGRQLLFGSGYGYATVGFGENGLNLLDPSAADAIIKGAPVSSPGAIKFGDPPDEEIIVQFASALAREPFATDALGSPGRFYAYGASQTAGALLETLHAPGGSGLFDLTLLHIAMWRPPFSQEYERLLGEFEPLAGVGRVVFVGSEGDQVVSDAEQFRRAAHVANHRVYEVAGAAHAPGPRNPLDHFAVLRAVFVAGDRWVRLGVEPPPSTLMAEAAPGEIDPVYGFVTGIARDGDGNARGGVRLGDLHVGRAQYIAFDVTAPGLPVNGTSIDLSCAPAAGADDGPRFPNHGSYVSDFVSQVNRLRAAGFLLPRDAEAMKEAASSADVGKPWSCPV